MVDIIKKVRHFIQQISIEFWVLISFIFMFIAFVTNHYYVRFGNRTDGITIFEEIYGIKIGWLLFLMLFSGYTVTLVFCSIDNHYSKRAKLSFQISFGFTAFIFVTLTLWLLIDDNYEFYKEKILGEVFKAGFGFSFYWFIFHLLTSGIIAFLYQSYIGTGEPSVYKWLQGIFNKDSTVKINTNEKYEELRKAKAMFDEGIFTEEEFLLEKNKILSKYE